MDVLVAGFAPWGSTRSNPSGQVARKLGGHVLPVHWSGASRRLQVLLRREKPKAILLLGLGSGRRRIELEAVALNVDHCEDPAWRRRRRPIRRGGALALPSRLPLDRLLAVLRSAGIPAGLSHHAGTFLCNHVFYLALRETRVPCGFIHLPPTDVLALKDQLRAVEKVLEVLRGRPSGAGKKRPLP